jgi:hypothetical protein
MIGASRVSSWPVMPFGNWQDYDARMIRPTTPTARAKAAADAFVPAAAAGGLDAARAAAARAWNAPAVATAPVVWLRDHADDLAPPDAADVAGLRAFLLALESEGPASVPAPEAASADEPLSALDAPLCALCRGRCCRFGLDGRAFLEPQHLRAWLARHPGASWADAVDHWLGFIGAEHLRASCLFHGRGGCTLPRERRSDVCNQFACDALEQARDAAAASPDAVVVAGIAASHELRGAAVVSADGVRPLLP